MLQLQASLSKNFTEKRRTLKVTCCEFFSHFIIIILLIYGYGLSEVSDFPDEDYSTIQLVIPPRTTEDFLGILNGPLPIPSIDSFVSLSRFINPGGEQGSTGGFSQFSFIKQYDNLLYLGTLHFAPNNEATADLVRYLNNTYSTFSTLRIRIHDSEKKAVNYILSHLDERTLALIVLKQIDMSYISYKIRLNYTTLPNTNEVVNSVALGLDVTYQRYFFSGFLSLKDAVDGWVFNYTGIDSNQINLDNSYAFIGSDLAHTTSCSKPDFYFTPYPTPKFNQNIFYTSVGFLLGLALTSKLFSNL
jgi:ATP-binding cassette subfamily A (ABC1) protein 3